MKKVIVKFGLNTRFELPVGDEATVGSVLSNSTTVDVCGSHAGARVDGVEVDLGVVVKEGMVIEPFTKDNEKGC